MANSSPPQIPVQAAASARRGSGTATPAATPRAGAATTVILRVLDLRGIRDGMGEEWERRCQQVHGTLQKDLKQLLSERGWFWPHGDNFYFLVFWLGAADVVEDICTRIRAQTSQHLKGLRVDFGELPLPINAGHLDERGRLYVDRNESDEEPAPIEGAAPEAPEPSFAFEPVWNVRQGVVSAFRCVSPARDSRIRTVGESLTAEAEQVASDAHQDGLLLAHVIAEWGKLPAGAVCLLIVPVHYETLASAGARRRYLEIAAGMPERLRKFLVFELTHLPAGVMAERLQDLTRYLKRFCRMTTVLTAIGFDQFRVIAKAEISIVSCVAEGGSERRLFEQMDRFAEGATAQQLQPGIYGVRSPSLTTGAIGSGFVYVGGEAIRSLGEAPVGFFKFEMADVYRGGGAR